jgi:hypothetical protein
MHTVSVQFRRCATGALGLANKTFALASVVGCLVMAAPPAWSAPGDQDGAGSPTLALPDLGYESTLEFWGLDDTQQLSLPVQHGLTPTALNATVELPINLRSGFIMVTQDQHDIAKVNLPTADQTPIVIPLAGAQVVDNALSVSVHAYLTSVEGACLYAGSPLRLRNATVTYTGTEQLPATVAHFMPPVLRKLSIFLPESPSTAESDAAVRLATAAYAHYGRQAPEIAVLPLGEGQAAPTTPATPMERQVVIKEGPDNGLSLKGAPGAPWLLLSGPLWQTDESNTAVLFSGLSRLALASKVTAGPIKSGSNFPGDQTTLRALGQPSLSSTSLRPRVSIGLDQTRWGRSVHDVHLHLKGSYSPTPANVGGQITVKIGSEIVDHWPTDGQGNIDRVVDIPDRLLQRYTSLDVTLNVAANVGHCGDFYIAGPGDQLLTLAINGDSTVSSSPAAPPVPGGLRSMPQALMPRLQVGIEPHSFADTVRAVSIMQILQRMSAAPIDTVVGTVQQAIDSPDPAILVAADGWNHPDIALPVAAASSGPITLNSVESDGKPTTLTLDPALQFASIQTAFNRGRSLLVATSNGAPAQLDELLRWLDSDGVRWPRLGGVAVVSVPGQDPVTVDRTEIGGHAASSKASDGHSGLGWLWWLGGGWVAVAVVGAAVIILRSRAYR